MTPSRVGEWSPPQDLTLQLSWTLPKYQEICFEANPVDFGTCWWLTPLRDRGGSRWGHPALGTGDLLWDLILWDLILWPNPCRTQQPPPHGRGSGSNSRIWVENLGWNLGFLVLAAGAPSSLPCASTRPKECLHPDEFTLQKAPDTHRRRHWSGDRAARAGGTLRWGGGKGTKLRGGGTYPVAAGAMPAVASHLPPHPAAPGCRSLAGGSPQEEVAAGRLWVWLGTWLIRLAEPRLLPSSPHSEPIHAQQSPWVMRKRCFTLTPLHKPVQS